MDNRAQIGGKTLLPCSAHSSIPSRITSTSAWIPLGTPCHLHTTAQPALHGQQVITQLLIAPVIMARPVLLSNHRLATRDWHVQARAERHAVRIKRGLHARALCRHLHGWRPARHTAQCRPWPWHAHHGGCGLSCCSTLRLAQLRHVLLRVVAAAQLRAQVHQVPQALDVGGVLLVDGLVARQRLRVRADPPEAAGHHERPLGLLRLDLGREVEEGHGLLVHLVLDVVRAQPRDDVHVDGVHAVRLLVVVQRARLVVEARVDGAQLGQHARVVGHQRRQHLQPLDRLLEVAQDVVAVGQLPDDVVVVGQHGMQLLERRQRGLRLAQL
mmetsp:Transcript_37625/g.95031  ORF Transcript_37625/g.95031 Transcript_37625/m.95031 type:complete len:327 (-) Transcript_37625:1686-2666(-)